MQVINNVTNLPVIRPVACLDKLEIIDISKKIDTYDISILPFEDCCTVFVPRHPVINPELSKCIEMEKSFDYEEMINDALKNKILNKDGKIKVENGYGFIPIDENIEETKLIEIINEIKDNFREKNPEFSIEILSAELETLKHHPRSMAELLKGKLTEEEAEN